MTTFNLIIVNLLTLTCLSTLSLSSTAKTKTKTETPTPTAWPQQFHSLQVIKYNNTYQVVDLWYDWPKGRNLNIIQHQLGKLLYDLEWNNGTSFYYTLPLNGDGESKECKVIHFDVGILVPNWLDGAQYLGQQQVDGFLCNVWQKVDFLWYYEDVLFKRPVKWKFYTGRETHVMTFEVGAVLEDEKWQAPVYCFDQSNGEGYSRHGFGTASASSKNVLDGTLKGYTMAM